MIEKIFNDLLSQMGAGSRELVSLSVTPGVGLELVQLDLQNKLVKTYGCKPLEYSDSLRDISDYDAFRAALSELFTELNVSPKCNIVLNLPLVHFGKIELPLLLNDDGITEAIISEVEQSYTFKRCEPVVSWVDASNANSSSETRSIFYSALQKPVIDKIKNILTEMGAVLVGVECSLISELRGLLYSEKTEQQMADGVSWNLMIVTATGYSIVSLLGKSIIDYYEEPLALKTYEPEEIYNAVASSAQISLMNSPANYLYILSNTDLVNAELLSGKLTVDGQVSYLDNNGFKKEEIVPASLDILPDVVQKISLEAIGIAASRICAYPIVFEFSGNKPVEVAGPAVEESISFNYNGKEIILTAGVLQKMAIAISAILIVPPLAVLLTIPNLQKSKQAELDDINSKISTLDGKIKEISEKDKNTGFVVKDEIARVMKNNRAKLLSYSALGESVPSDLWITYFSSKDDGKIDIKGQSENVEDIYVFFRNMKDYLIDTQLRLYKLEMASTSVDEAVSSSKPDTYEFEITNLSETELNPSAPAEGDGKSADANAQGGDNAKKDAPPASGAKKVSDLEPVEPKK